MFVIKRNGKKENIQFDRITERLKNLVEKEPRLTVIDPVVVAQKVVAGIFPGIKTQDLDNLAAETAAYMSTIHPEYELLASRIVISNLHKQTLGNTTQLSDLLYNYVNKIRNEKCPLISQECYEIMQEFGDVIATHIDYERDYSYDFFGYKTLEKSYLIKINRVVVERPQDMLIRVAIGIHGRDIENILKTYNLMSKKYYTHATPTLNSVQQIHKCHRVFC
jgi:ribonucleoside-diphosphate reductase subunit M1